MDNYNVGDIVKGRVTGVQDYGIFLLVNNKDTGLIHISEISDSYVRNILDYVSIDEVISAKVIDYDKENGKLKLSIKDFPYHGNSRKYRGIKETPSGFSNLGKKLDEWILDKEAKMKEKM